MPNSTEYSNQYRDLLAEVHKASATATKYGFNHSEIQINVAPHFYMFLRQYADTFGSAVNSNLSEAGAELCVLGYPVHVSKDLETFYNVQVPSKWL